MTSARRTSPALRELRFDAGSLSLNLAATVGRRGGGNEHRIERLRDTESLARWCEGVGIVLGAGVDAEALLGDLRRLREAVYEVAGAHVRGDAPSTSAVDELNTRAAVPVPPATLTAARDGLRVSMPGLSASEVCSTVARDLIQILAGDDARARLRECDGDDCRMVYLLSAGARERRWCSMSRCGNRAKAAAHRARVGPLGRG